MNAPTFRDVARELERVLDASEADLTSIGEAQAGTPRAAGKWSPKEIVGHLIDSASNNHQRFVRGAQQRGLHLSGYDQEWCVTVQRPNEISWTLLVSLWTSYNRYLAHVIASMPADAASHPIRIGDGPRVDLLWVATDYVEHLKHHVNQLIGARFSSTYPKTPTPRAVADDYPYATHLNVLFGGLEKISLDPLIGAVRDQWYNQTLVRVNDSVVRLGVMQGEYHWHEHTSDDELFYVLDGRFLIDLEPAADGVTPGRVIDLRPREGFVVPKGVRHRTRAPERSVILMVETATITPTGD